MSEGLRALNDRERMIIGRARLRQGPVMAAVKQVVDAQDRIGAPYVALSTLTRMEQCGTITPAHRAAGEEFHRLFRLACLDGLRAVALDGVSGGGRSGQGAAGNERARRMIAEAIRALGGEGTLPASCAWYVLGLEWSLRQWSEIALRGKVDRAVGVLVAALSIMEPHFRA